MPRSSTGGKYFTAYGNKTGVAEAGEPAQVRLPFRFETVTMDRATFEQFVNEALERLPKKFRDKLHNVVVEVEESPSAELLEDMGISSGTLFGLYQGVPLTEREWNYGNALPDRIVIYQRPIESVAATREEIEEIIMDTVAHEIGHYFGFDDAALYEIEGRKTRRRAGRKGRK